MKNRNTWNAKNAGKCSKSRELKIWRSKSKKHEEEEVRPATTQSPIANCSDFDDRKFCQILMMRFSASSIRNFLRGGTTVVALYSVMIAGPR